MKKAIVVGGDWIKTDAKFLDTLARAGFQLKRHIDGHQPKSQARQSKMQCDLLIIIVPFVNHNTMRSFTEMAKKQGIPVIRCDRHTHSLEEKLHAKFEGQGQASQLCVGRG